MQHQWGDLRTVGRGQAGRRQLIRGDEDGGQPALISIGPPSEQDRADSFVKGVQSGPHDCPARCLRVILRDLGSSLLETGGDINADAPT
jgi:hypothetical protein